MARRFRFPLEAVLQQRLAAEEARQRRVAELERERVAVEDRVRAYQAAISAAREDLRRRLCMERRAGELRHDAREAGGEAGGVEVGGGGVSLADVRMQANASLHMVARARQAVLELAGVHSRLDAARLELLRATTDRKAVELLKEKRYREWLDERRRREDGELDEINVTRHGRAEGMA
jgi:flagellar export protein FliJ